MLPILDFYRNYLTDYDLYDAELVYCQCFHTIIMLQFDELFFISLSPFLHT